MTEKTKKHLIVWGALVSLVVLGACATLPKNLRGSGKTTYPAPSSFSTLLQNYGELSDQQRVNTLNILENSELPTAADHQQICYMLARLLQKSSNSTDLDRAIELYKAAAGQQPLWERCQIHISECAAIAGRETAARAALNSLLAESNDPEIKAAANYGLAQSYLRANEIQNAQDTFKLVRANFPHSQYATGALYYLGCMALASDQEKAQGIKSFRSYLQQSPDGHFAVDIVQKLQTQPGYKPTKIDHELIAQAYFLAGKYPEAIEHWNKSRSTAQFVDQAVCRLKLKKTQNAKQILVLGIRRHHNSPQVVPAAELLSRISSHQEAVNTWKEVLKTSPRYADAALWNLAIRDNLKAAQPLYRTLLKKYSASKFAPEATWAVVWYDATHGKTGVALNSSKRALAHYRQSKAAPRFAFWIGKFEEQLKRKDKATQSYLWTSKQYPVSYYGWRARARLNALAGAGDPGWGTEPSRNSSGIGWKWPDSPTDIKPEIVQVAGGPTVASLMTLRQWDEALQVMPETSDPTIKAWCFAKLELPLQAINAAANNISGIPYSNSRWRFAYPLLYGTLVSNNAQLNRIDPYLVHALIREESRYYAHALSRSNAIGLMQLLPQTAQLTADQCNLHLSSLEDIFTPDNNVQLGTKYLGSLLQHYKGNALAAVASYNGGGNAIHGWQAKGMDGDVVVENIPFDETRDYVRKVFGSYWNYNQIYSDTSSK